MNFSEGSGVCEGSLRISSEELLVMFSLVSFTALRLENAPELSPATLFPLPTTFAALITLLLSFWLTFRDANATFPVSLVALCIVLAPRL